MTYIISEIGINHNGHMGIAKKLIAKSHKSGCDAIKLQKRNIDLVYTKEDLDKPRESPWGTTNREQKQGLEFNFAQHKELQDYCQYLGMDYILSCWDIDSLKQTEEKLNIKYHKVASALACDTEFIEVLNETEKPVILSIGMCTQEEVDMAISLIDNLEFILCCTSTYPTNVDELNLKHILYMKDKYPQYKIGFSNHYSGHDACIGATALGSECIEFHITHDRTAYGSDQAASIQNSEGLVNGIRNMEKMAGNGVKRLYASEMPVMKKLRK